MSDIANIQRQTDIYIFSVRLASLDSIGWCRWQLKVHITTLEFNDWDAKLCRHLSRAIASLKQPLLSAEWNIIVALTHLIEQIQYLLSWGMLGSSPASHIRKCMCLLAYYMHGHPLGLYLCLPLSILQAVATSSTLHLLVHKRGREVSIFNTYPLG